MIKVRVMNPAAGMANRSVSQYPTSRLRYMAYHISRNGTGVATIQPATSTCLRP